MHDFVTVRLRAAARSFALLSTLLALMLFAVIRPAAAHFIDGYLAACSATGVGTCTEFVASSGGYARQPMFFNAPTKGATSNAFPYNFGSGFTGTVAGFAIYDAPTGGNLLLVIPLATSLVVTSPALYGDVAAIKLNFTAMAAYFLGEGYAGTAAATTAIGTTGDGSTLYSGVALYIWRGLLAPQSTFP